MIGLMLLAYKGIGGDLKRAVSHILGDIPMKFEVVSVNYDESPEKLFSKIQNKLVRLGKKTDIIILSDIWGATHTNVANRFVIPGHIELIAGFNLPMLVRFVNYRHLPLKELVEKTMAGGHEGIIRFGGPDHKAKAS